MGSIDENGIYEYAEDEPAAPGGLFSGLLNKLASSVSTAVAALVGRVTSLEAITKRTDIITTGIVSPTSDWKINNQKGLKLAGSAQIDFEVELTGSDIIVPPTGDIGNVIIATLSTTWAATTDMRSPLASTYAGRVTSAYITNDGPGQPQLNITMSSVAPGGTITAGDRFSFAGTYPLQ